MDWKLRRGQIKHLLYEHCLNERIDKELLKEQFNDLNNVEPIVRCEDCKWWHTDGVCRMLSNNHYPVVYMDDDDFCSRGERKEVENGI